MSFDLAIWKCSATTKTAMIVECYDTIIEDKDHPAMEHFDEEPLLKGLEAEFGIRKGDYFGEDIDDCPFLYSKGGGEFGNWFSLNLTWSKHQETTIKVIEIALKEGLMVYDPQKQAVRGNERPPKIKIEEK